MLDNDVNRIGSDAWRERHAGPASAAPMTVASARGQLDQPSPQSAPQGSSFESEAHAALVRIARNYNDHLDETDRNAVDPTTGRIELTPALKAAHAAFANSDDAKGIDVVEKLASESVAEKQLARVQIRKSLVREGDTAAEIRATRRWEADRALLDAQDGSLGIGQRLIEEADDADLSYRVEQLPRYYAARGVDATPVIDAALTKRCPELASADREARLAEMNAAVLKADAARLRNGIASGTKIRTESLINPAKCAHNT